jgi:hypothetical protein
MQAQAGDARKYQALLEYLSRRGVPASFVTAPDYRAAADDGRPSRVLFFNAEDGASYALAVHLIDEAHLAGMNMVAMTTDPPSSRRPRRRASAVSAERTREPAHHGEA